MEIKNIIIKLKNRREEIFKNLFDNDNVFMPDIIFQLVIEIRTINSILRTLEEE